MRLGLAAPAMPPSLPDGAPWPRVDVLVVDLDAENALAATQASVELQDYPGLALCPVDDASASLARAVAASEADYVVWLPAGDRLAPGAVAALVLAARLDGADIAAGLRLLVDHDDDILGIDVLAPRPGPLAEADALAASRGAAASPAWQGGDVLIARAAIERCGGLSPLARDPLADILPRLARTGARISRIGRPVLLRRAARDTVPAPKTLRVAALNDAGFEGGAGIAHRRLIDALRLGGHAVAAHRLVDESPKAAAEWTDDFGRTQAAILAGTPDLVLVGNVHGATRSAAVLEGLARHVPLAVVLHDLFMLTGRCAHPAGCTRIETGCDALCPTPDFYPQLAPDRIAGAFADKRRLLSGPQAPLLLANSHWTEAEARRLAPAGTPIARVDLAFPSDVFRPGDKAALRRRLGLPPDDVLILFAAVIADQADKGAGDLAAALAQVARPGVGFVALGRIDDPGAFPLPGLVAPGPIADEAELAAWYGACDLHVSASRLETLGQTPVEAGLCGVPTVAYGTTGLATAVIDGVSGVLVEPRPDALAQAVSDLVGDPARRALLSACGRIALESRHSPAAACLAIHEALSRHGLLPAASEDGRIRLAPSAAASFLAGPAAASSSTPNVAPAPGAATRLLRRLKHRVWGRAQPLWMRRALYLAARLRGLGRGA